MTNIISTVCPYSTFLYAPANVSHVHVIILKKNLYFQHVDSLAVTKYQYYTESLSYVQKQRTMDTVCDYPYACVYRGSCENFIYPGKFFSCN